MTAAAPTIKLWVNDRFEQHVSLARAIRLLHAEKVEIVEYEDGVFIRSATGKTYWPMPKVLRLIRYVQIAYDRLYGPPQISKRGVLARDNHTCAYCGAPGANTVDHVQPRSKGGKSSWMNLVAACRECNNRKRNRTPEEAGMKLRVTPFAPKRKAFGFVA
jgi:5-methylcytosine-specific restriction endonuclease McrA